MSVFAYAAVLTQAFLTATVTAAPLASSNTPTVNLTVGQYQGFQNNSVDWFLGVPFAQPPVNELRFKKAVPATWEDGIHNATEWSDICPSIQQANNFGTTAFPPAGEDCLHINVMRPSGIPYDTKLPLLFWIYGGGFTNGAASQYDPTAILQQSVAMGKPIAYAAPNYRLNAFGFLYNENVTAADDANAGLQDQTLALQWIQDNADALGIDETKVTIWGESAGGFSSEAQTIYAPSGLFRASIADSAYITLGAQFPEANASSFWVLSNATGCGLPSDTTADAAYQCLVDTPFDTLLNVSETLSNAGVSWGPVIAGSFLDEPPVKRLAERKYNVVPNIMGTNHDEGSFFGGNFNTSEEILEYIETMFNDGTAQVIFNAYKNDPDLQNTTVHDLGWAVGGDIAFLADRRNVSATFAQTQPIWSYLFSQPPPGEQGAEFGAYHSSELHFLFPIWREDGTPDDPAAFQQLQETMIGYWVNFVNDLDPNGDGLLDWPELRNDVVVEFIANGTRIISDDFRKTETTLITEAEVAT